MTYGTVLARALVAALAVGLLAGGYLLTVVEPVVDRAIALEEEMSAAAPAEEAGEADHHEEPLYTRGEQKGGGGLAMVLFALVLGLAAGTLFAWRRHVLPGATDFHRAVWLAAMGFVAFALVPGIKYPANPPAVGDPDTVGERTLQYVGVIVLSLVLVVALTRLSRVLRATLDDPTRIIAVAAASVVAFGILMAVLPGTPDAIDPAVPAALVWDFRLRSLGGLALLWLGFGLVFGGLLTRVPATAEAPQGARLAPSGA
ncbi:MAG: CbtA family protein [Acidimicrobiia bacterium]